MTTNRTMCRLLSDALDALTPVQRRVLIKASQENGRSAWFAGLLDALVVQSAFDEASRRQQDDAILAAFEVDAARELDEVEARTFGPRPQRTEGEEWWPEG